jgi:hypothetical protein
VHVEVVVIGCVVVEVVEASSWCVCGGRDGRSGQAVGKLVVVM